MKEGFFYICYVVLDLLCVRIFIFIIIKFREELG